MSLTGPMSTNRRKGFSPFSYFRRGRPLTSKDLEKENFSSPQTRMRDKGWLSRNGGYIVFFCIFLVFMQTGLYASQNYHAGVSSQSSQTTSWTSMFSSEKPKPEIQHPIPNLMNNAEAEFRKKVERQSKTLKDAVAEYKRRYKMPPPRDFDRWWQFARENNVVMVDEYDGLMRDLAPFHQLPGEEIRRRTLQVGTLPSINIVRVRNGEATTVNLNEGFKDSEVSARAHGFRKMLDRFVHTLPDIDFPINTKAEGRVIIPWEHQAYPNMTQQDSSEGIESLLGGPFIADWRGDGNVWNAWRRTCEPGSPARRLFSSVRNVFAQQPHNFMRPPSSISSSPSDFVFAKETSCSIDFCQHPHAHFSQGHFFSDWRTIPALYPVFSPARAQGFMDIKIPSHYYWGSTKRYTYGWDPVNLQLKDVDDMEVPWEDKIDKIFWRGATTGGGSNPRGFTPQYQRHRFLRMSSQDGKDNSTRTVVFADPPTSENYVAAEANVGELNEEIMDTAFVKATSPETYPGGLKALMRDHRFGDSVPLGRHWSYKYLLDLDGMSYSGRFLAFLASDSVPIKNTVYEEFFSDWIQPWVHFVPLSTTYQEIYNIYAYFSGGPRPALEAVNSTELLLSDGERSHRVFDGQNRARRIARAGKQWKKTIGRTVDMEVYVYRLALEYARLWADDREAWVYGP